MSEQDNVKSGYWSIATQKHLKAYRTDSSNIDEFDTLNTAGKAGRLLGDYGHWNLPLMPSFVPLFDKEFTGMCLLFTNKKLLSLLLRNVEEFFDL